MAKLWGPVRFYRESRRFTQGWSRWKFYRHLPKAFLIFYGMALSDFIKYGIRRGK